MEIERREREGEGEGELKNPAEKDKQAFRPEKAVIHSHPQPVVPGDYNICKYGVITEWLMVMICLAHSHMTERSEEHTSELQSR